jgi:hypothetical protein
MMLLQGNQQMRIVSNVLKIMSHPMLLVVTQCLQGFGIRAVLHDVAAGHEIVSR